MAARQGGRESVANTGFVDPKTARKKLDAAKRLQAGIRAGLVRSKLRALFYFQDEVLRKPLDSAAVFAWIDQILKEVEAEKAAAKAAEEAAQRPASASSRASAATSSSKKHGGGVPPSVGQAASERGSSEQHEPALPMLLEEPEPMTEATEEQFLTFVLRVKADSTEESAGKLVKTIFKLLKTKVLTKSCLDRIWRHHKLRLTNLLSKTSLRLVIVQHGSSQRVPVMSMALPGAEEPSVPSDCSRGLLPEGWEQVSRTAWNLTLWPEFQPDLVLTSGVACAQQTAERLRAVAKKENLDLPHEFRSDSKQRAKAGKAKEFPPAMVRSELEPPAVAGIGLAPSAHYVADAVANAVAQIQNPSEIALTALPVNVLLVAGSMVLQSLLSFMTVDSARDSVLCLGPGDCVILKLATILRVIFVEDEERFRYDDELWAEGLRRTNWEVIAHMRGDGKGPLVLPDTASKGSKVRSSKGSKKAKGHAPESEQEAPGTEPFGKTWRRIVGQPLIYSQHDFYQLCTRAGRSDFPLSAQEIKQLVPLVHEVQLPPKEKKQVTKLKKGAQTVALGAPKSKAKAKAKK